MGIVPVRVGYPARLLRGLGVCDGYGADVCAVVPRGMDYGSRSIYQMDLTADMNDLTA